MRSRASVLRRLGVKGEEAERLIAGGMTKAAVARKLGVDSRLISFLRATPSAPAPDASGGRGEASGATPEAGHVDGTLAEYRRLLDRAIPVRKRVALVRRAIDVGLKAQNPLLLGQALRAVERADEVSGLVTRKGEGQEARTGPIFALPTCSCQMPRLHGQGGGSAYSTKDTGEKRGGVGGERGGPA